MSINFTSLSPSEHDNGVALGSLSSSGAEVGSFDVYWDNQKDLFRIVDDVLYLTDHWHYDADAGTNGSGQYRSYTPSSDGISWSSFAVADLTVKYTQTSGGNNWGVVESSDFSFANVNETITLSSLAVEAFDYGAQVASVAAGDVEFSTFGTTSNFLTVENGALALSSGTYYNPNSQRIVLSDNSYYDLSGEGITTGITLYDENEKVVAYESLAINHNLFSNVTLSNTPHYVGSSTTALTQSDDEYIKSLLFEDPLVWSTDPVNTSYQTDASETVITYSFSGISGAPGEYESGYSIPDPTSDGIFPFSETHMAATRLALGEFENIANLKFVEIEETQDQVGTLRFAFTDAEYRLDSGVQAAGWASAPYSNAAAGDVWINSSNMAADNNWDQNTSTNFSTLLHEIGHTLGLNHPFDEPYLIPTGFDFSNYTLMSYTDPDSVWWYPYWADSGSYTLSSTPMVYDIAALQYLYGAADYSETDTVYSYDVATPFAETIWDSGGNDTLDFANFNTDLKISLKQGSYSTVPFTIADPSDASTTLDWSMTKNLGISFGAAIENVNGGAGNDAFVGNSGNNTIQGGAGDDLIFFSGGNDIVDGGSATDILLIGSREAYGFSSEIGEAVPSFAIQPIAEGSSDNYVYFKIGSNQTRTQNIETFEINGVAYDADPSSNHYLGVNFETYDPTEVVLDDTDDTSSSDTQETTVTETQDDSEGATTEEATVQEPFSDVLDVNVVSKSGVALNQALGSLTGLAIDSVSDEDYYKFVVSGDETYDLSVIFNHSDGDIDATLYDENGNWLEAGTSVSDNEVFSLNAAGTYYLHVYGYAGAQANYSLSAVLGTSLTSDQYEANNTMSSAYDFGTITSSDAADLDNLTIHAAGDDDYYKFAINSAADISVTVNFDHDEGDVDIELLDSAGNWVGSSATTSDEESIEIEGLSSGEYYLRVYGYADAVSSSYSIDASITIEESAHSQDAYETNGNFNAAHSLGSITSASTVVSNANIHNTSDEDYYSFTLVSGQNLGLEAIFSHTSGDLDIEILDSNENWIDGSSSASDNEYLSLSGFSAGTYTLRAYGYAEATPSDYSIRFVEEVVEDWEQNYDNWWAWQQADNASNISADSFETSNNDSFFNASNLGDISSSQNINDLTIDSSGDDDWFKFSYDPATRLDVSIGFDASAADLDIELYNSNFDWIDGSYGVEGLEEISLVGLASGEYYIKIYEYSNGTVGDYDLSFSVSAGSAIADLNDTYEPNNSFLTATDMGDATGEGIVTNLTLTSGDVDWYKAYFANDGTPDQYVSAVFDHQDGDIDVEFYDDTNTLLRSSTSVTDNETIYLSDIEGGSYYYMRVSAYGDTAFQGYSLEYSFPVVVTADAINADALEGSSGNNAYSAASSVGLVSQTNDLTIDNINDSDWFSFTTRNPSSSASEVSISYDAALGAMNLSLWAVDIGASAPTMITSFQSGTGREVIDFGGYVAGTYYLQAFGQDGALIPDYSLSMNVTEVEGAGSQSNVIAADQFDRASSNDTSSTATELGTLSATLNAADLNIQSSTDKDFLKFGTTYAGETQINLAFSHAAGDIDASLRNSGGTEVAVGMSGDDNETLTFQSSVGETYTLEVYGYNGETNRDYDLTITPKQLSSRRDDYETNDSSAQALTVRDARASFDNLTLHNASDQDWFKFTIADTAGASNKVQVTNLLGANAELKIYSSDGTTQVGSTVSITSGSGLVDTSGYEAGDYYAVVSSTASSGAAASAQLSNYNLYVDQLDGAASATNASWTVMVYIDGDNNLASAAVDDINEMEGVDLPESVNVVTLTDLSGDYDTSAGWTDTRQGEIIHDPNGYNMYAWAGGSWAEPADALTSNLVSVGEKNMGDPTTLTDFINWSTTNHAADNYALVLWDHGGGLSGIAWDDTNNHDNLSMSDIKSAIDNSSAFSSTNKLDLIGFDACLMQTYELGLEMAPLADVMVASQELEPDDGWDYQAFLQSLADNPYASAKTLGGYIVDSYDTWYDSSEETLSSVDLSKFQAIDDAIATFNSAAQSVSGSEWLIMDDAAENAWSSARHSYGRMGEDRDLGQFFEYISENSSDNTLKTAAASVKTAIDAAVVSNSSRQDLSGIQVGLLKSDASIWSGTGLIGKNGSAWGQFQQLHDFADRSVRSATAENLTPDYSETSDALGRSSQGNNTSLTAFEIGTVTNATLVDSLTIHNAQDVDWYSFATPGGLDASGNALKVNATNTAPIKVALYDGNRELIAQREGLESSFNLSASSTYFIKVETSTGRQDIAYKLDVDLVAADTSQEIIVADLAEGSSSNDVVAKATELTFNTESNTTFSNLGLSLTNGDQDWFEISAGRLSEQSPNLFSVVIDDSTLTSKEDVVIELADASGTVLATSTAIGGNETVIYEDYTSDIFINVKSGSGKVLDYKLDLRHADYDVDGSGSVSSATDGEAILSSLFSNTTTTEVAGNLLDATTGATSLSSFVTDYSNTLLDVDGDGVTKASTDGVIINAYIAGASADLLLPLISSTSPITTSDELLTHLLDIA